VEGHADASEGPAAKLLAQQRAQRVYDALVSLGVAPSALTIVNLGTTRPAVTGPDAGPAGQTLNARVQVWIVPHEEER
jgi:outer membrane protein OmpA-like peptidoglycan-associated protein